ncbi:hypothetical protein UA08_08761 [Talaromyces atroroseus]|uniref:Ammonium transporter AmtB-like domain-containing protein n=1 Tax=Talaromyces atroroseus TaxID=1441469 RepID=A0A225AMB5_TALAT|nr:hypothetical protein UA08_08761 [Talaromyces atroroseus]OKL56076.1 hypothetical protein UA08_08761 [Talaromyces atroroseus]
MARETPFSTVVLLVQKSADDDAMQSVLGGGFLCNLGVLDSSGGYVIHLRALEVREFLGYAGMGLMEASPYAASPDAGVALLNTNICTAMSLLVWKMLDYIFFKKPSVIGAIQGEITGLVAITPAAGLVTGWGAIIIGACSGSIPWISMNFLGRQKWMKHVDDVMGVIHTHTVAGFLGGFLTGIFATADGCAPFGLTTPGGAIDGNGRQVWVQIVGGLFIIGLDCVYD